MVRLSDRKEKFLPLEEVGEQVTLIRMTYEDVFEPVYDDEDKPTGEVIPTDYAKWTEEFIYGEVTVEKVKNVRLAELSKRDSSPEVNEFTFNGVKMWIPREMRDLFQKRLDNEVKWGNPTVNLTFNGVTYTLPVETAEMLLDTIEHYATNCFDVTQEHEQAIKALDNVDDLLAYDITTGYPEKLNIAAPSE